MTGKPGWNMQTDLDIKSFCTLFETLNVSGSSKTETLWHHDQDWYLLNVCHASVTKTVLLLTLGTHAQQGLQYSVCLSVCVCE